MLDNTEKFWEKAWIRHIETYLKSIPRAGIFISNYFKNIDSILEVAGGSCRDSRYLANSNYGLHVVGSDFDEKTLQYLQNRGDFNDKLVYSKEDAFSLTFKDNSFDLVFHNGFFVLFESDDDIYKMIREQERVSRKFIVFFVHNYENRRQVEQFFKLSKNDDLYKIRFFTRDEIFNIVKNSAIKSKNIKLLKFGGRGDIFYNRTFKRYIPNIVYPFSKYLIPRLYQLQKWKDTERICCIIELDK